MPRNSSSEMEIEMDMSMILWGVMIFLLFVILIAGINAWMQPTTKKHKCSKHHDDYYSDDE